AGATLPETGGIGTTIFYVLGTILVLGAGVLLVTKKRMNADK
ncbi:LPXTG cell wall anchor domain-containing protein, partial [Dysosmobacter sp.]